VAKENIFAKQNLNERTLGVLLAYSYNAFQPDGHPFCSRTAGKIVLPFLFVEGRDGRVVQ
jgi:hypothetical protein